MPIAIYGYVMSIVERSFVFLRESMYALALDMEWLSLSVTAFRRQVSTKNQRSPFLLIENVVEDAHSVIAGLSTPGFFICMTAILSTTIVWVQYDMVLVICRALRNRLGLCYAF